MIINFRHTYVRQVSSAANATNDSGTSIQGRNAAASCKPIYTGIHLRRTICVSKEAMERLLFSNPEGSLMAAQHFEPGDFTFRNRLAEPLLFIYLYSFYYHISLNIQWVQNI
ncbi:Hypothetical_protein [Hexamita inflata]|uniref:Hypothetical_protein n=1 Tax=Hexamita inflata TaxID=28002 RepID=A0AA86V516_9EUKA|nr:Hypothetical protein HINF_LOCUS64217 [Hexamita inflata]